MLRVVLAQPRGFCAGVERAIEIVERALKKYGPPIYVRHEIVHNRHVVEDLRDTRRACSSTNWTRSRPARMTVFSAHGVARRVEELAAERGLPVIDATCPLVAKVHNEGRRYAAQGREIVLVGHAGHAEVEGTIGQVPGTVHLVQTAEDVATLQVARPGHGWPTSPRPRSRWTTPASIIAALQGSASRPSSGPDVRDICYATQNRQQAVRELAGAGGRDPGGRLAATAPTPTGCARSAASSGKPSYLIDDADGAASRSGSTGVATVGLTAGASAPETLVQGVIDGPAPASARSRSPRCAGVAEDVRSAFPPSADADVADEAERD